MPPRGYTSFFHDVLIRNERDPGVHYRVYSYEGWYAYISLPGELLCLLHEAPDAGSAGRSVRRA